MIVGCCIVVFFFLALKLRCSSKVIMKSLFYRAGPLIAQLSENMFSRLIPESSFSLKSFSP